MKTSRFDWDGSDPRAQAHEIRTLQPALEEVTDAVGEIISAVESGGDAAVLEIAKRFGEEPAHGLLVPEEQLFEAGASVDTNDVETAISNVRAVAEAQLTEDREVQLKQGQTVGLRNVPVNSAGIYAPGGAATYPSTVIMGCVPAKVAGVERIVLATPPNENGEVDDIVLAAAEMSGANAIYAVGGAQAIAALAIGTDTVEPVDVIAGPGNRYVQEAKRQLVGRVGIDGIAGPSELMALVDASVELRWIALDLCAQAEHSDDGLLVACASDNAVLDELEKLIEEIARDRDTVEDAPLALVAVPSAQAAIELANAVAPEHLELACEGADVLARMVLYAGCVFTGPSGATALGDYAAGSNHVLPTGGAGRFQGPLGPGVFRRQVSTVQMTEDAARELAPTVATLARAEGFPVHAESVEVRGE
jgi:histidinol dehydrogenase